MWAKANTTSELHHVIYFGDGSLTHLFSPRATWEESVDTLPVHLFKDSFGPFLALLTEKKMAYTIREQRAGVPIAGASGILELVLSPAMWGALALVICAFLKNKRSRKVVITLKDKTIFHAEGLSPAEIEKLLPQARHLTAIEVGKEEAPKAVGKKDEQN